MERKHTFVYGIKGKLISAVAMLLVAVIMVVSSTYAWFTLSTAPEVTGITTNIGANGALEMALYNGTTPGDGMVGALDDNAKNTYWGNLVDLTSGYGLDGITLYPGELISTGGYLGGEAVTTGLKPEIGLLNVPVYGSDGRVESLRPSAFVGYYDQTDKQFFNSKPEGSTEGVRAVGVTSGMTDRQLAYREARSNASEAIARAKALAADSLNSNGDTLAAIAFKYVMYGASVGYNYSEISGLLGIIESFVSDEDEDVIDNIEKAYMYYVYVWAASAGSGSDDSVYIAVRDEIAKPTATLDSVINSAGATFTGSDIATEIAEARAALEQTIEDLETASEKISDLQNNSSITYTDVVGALSYIANPDQMLVNGFTLSEAKNNLGSIMGSTGGITVSVPTGSGVYADVADHCGSYNANVEVKNIVVNENLTVPEAKANMEATGINPSYSQQISTEATKAGQSAGGNSSDNPISEFYGYIIDLAFRTNAAHSNLLLQTAPIDRIYSDNETNPETMGHGSTMTFTVGTATYTINQMAELMNAVRVVFFETDTAKILANAKLNMTGYNTTGQDGTGFGSTAAFEYDVTTGTITANLYLYEVEYYCQINNVTYYVSEDGYYYYDGETRKTLQAATGTEGTDGYEAHDQALIDALDDASKSSREQFLPDGSAITALTQNAEHHISALVYFDGNYVKNSAVAADGTKSMTGKLNLQFSSDANLVPMDYADVKNPSTENETPTTPTIPTTLANTYNNAAAGTAVTLAELNGKEFKVYSFDAATQAATDVSTAWGVTTNSNSVTPPTDVESGDYYAIATDGTAVKIVVPTASGN